MFSEIRVNAFWAFSSCTLIDVQLVSLNFRQRPFSNCMCSSWDCNRYKSLPGSLSKIKALRAPSSFSLLDGTLLLGFCWLSISFAFQLHLFSVLLFFLWSRLPFHFLWWPLTNCCLISQLFSITTVSTWVKFVIPSTSHICQRRFHWQNSLLFFCLKMRMFFSIPLWLDYIGTSEDLADQCPFRVTTD